METFEIKTLAIIPARAGSKRLPRKNVLSLHDKPLICWSIEAALAVSQISRVVVSTDDDAVVACLDMYPQITHIKRPPNLATDTANTMDVLFQVLGVLELQGDFYDRVLLLQPTSPLRDATDIAAALELFDIKSAEAVISVTACEHSPLWSGTLPDDQSMQNFLAPSLLGIRSQDLPQYYRLNGAIYAARTDALKRYKNFFAIPKCYAYVMSLTNSVDIDQQFDLDFAQFLLRKRLEAG